VPAPEGAATAVTTTPTAVGATPGATPPGVTPSPAVGTPVAGPDPNGATAPIGGDPSRLALGAGDLAGLKLIEEGPVTAQLLAGTRHDPAQYMARLAEVGFVRGFRRQLVREGDAANRAVIVGGETDLFRDAAAAQGYWKLDAQAGWASPDPAARLDPVSNGTVGEESVVLRIVSGDSAARGYVVLFRRANAVAYVYALSQVAPLTPDDVVGIAKAVDARLR
jgi:hypothetical protein